MVQFDRLNDYGTFLAKREDAGEYIRKYRILKGLVSHRFEQTSGSYDNYVFENTNLEEVMKGAPEEYFEADNIWKKNHEASAQLNVERLKHIWDLCKMYHFELVICVWPMSPIFIEKNKGTFENKKNRFYEIMQQIGCEDLIIDLHNEVPFFNSDFRNLTHLNTKGGIKCSIELNRILEERKNQEEIS